MSILAVGSVAFDNITTPSGHADNVLGGAATYFGLAASYFTDVRIVAVVGEDFTAEHENVLKKRGVDTRGIEHAKGTKTLNFYFSPIFIPASRAPYDGNFPRSSSLAATP